MELEEYGFTDKVGYPLELCVDYIAILDRLKAAEAKLCGNALTLAVMESVILALKGEPVSDFMESFGDVQESMQIRAEMLYRAESAERRVAELESGLREIAENISIGEAENKQLLRELTCNGYREADFIAGVNKYADLLEEAAELYKLAERNKKVEAESKSLREALESIEEYWNRDNNEKAMHDACWHAVDTAHAALNGGRE